MARSSLTILFLALFLAFFSTIDATSHKKPDRKPNHLKFDIQAFNVPLSTGAQSLPGPEGTLKAITIGRGTQNYTCNTTTTAPVLVGAVASLLDLGPLLSMMSVEEGMKVINLLPDHILEFEIDTVRNIAAIPVLGEHFFDQLGVPTFDLGKVGLARSKKIPGGNIAAPAEASSGQDGTGNGAVDWLKLGDAGESRDLNQLYRVVTAGGKPPAKCEKEGGFEVQYAALYWFYG